MHLVIVILVILFTRSNAKTADPLPDADDKGEYWFLEKVIRCGVKHNITRQQALDIMYNEEPFEPNTKCYLSCLYQEFEIMNDGKFDGDAYLQHMDMISESDEKMMKKAEQIADACDRVNSEPVSDGSDGCDRAALIQECVINETLKEPVKFNFERAATLCQKEINITLEQMAQLMNDRLPLDQPSKCWIKCVLEEFTIFGDDQMLNITAWDEYMEYMYEDEPEEEAEQKSIGRKCARENGLDMHDNDVGCGRATLIVRCARLRGIEQDKYDYTEDIMECAIRFGATYEQVEQVVEQDLFDPQPYEVQCFMSCVVQLHGVFSPDGDILEGPFNDLLEKRAVYDDQIEWEKRIFHNCEKFNDESYGDDYGCQKGYNIINCFAEEKDIILEIFKDSAS